MEKIKEKEQIFDGGGGKSFDNESQSVLRENEWYKKKIVDMVNRIDNEDYIISIYSFIKVFFED